MEDAGGDPPIAGFFPESSGEDVALVETVRIPETYV
jgi:hypothetical protein